MIFSNRIPLLIKYVPEQRGDCITRFRAVPQPLVFQWRKFSKPDQTFDSEIVRSFPQKETDEALEFVIIPTLNDSARARVAQHRFGFEGLAHGRQTSLGNSRHGSDRVKNWKVIRNSAIQPWTPWRAATLIVVSNLSRSAKVSAPWKRHQLLEDIGVVFIPLPTGLRNP